MTSYFAMLRRTMYHSPAKYTSVTNDREGGVRITGGLENIMYISNLEFWTKREGGLGA